MVVNQFNTTESYTAMLLGLFDNLQMRIDTQRNLYTIKLFYSNASRLYKKLGNPDESYTYRTPIMGLTVDVDTDSSLDRNTNPMLKRKMVEDEGSRVTVTFNDKPTDYKGTLTIIADTMSSLSNIVESINAMFVNNVLYCTYNSPLGETIRTPIILEDIDMQVDNNTDIFEEKRLLQAVVSLRVEGVVHSIYNNPANRIEEINLLIHDYTLQMDNIIQEYTIPES